MENRSKRPMITFWELVLISLPLISYWYTSILWLLLPLPAAVLYSIFGALARHHQNQPFIEPKKFNLYEKLHMKFKLGLILSYFGLEFIAVYWSTMPNS